MTPYGTALTTEHGFPFDDRRLTRVTVGIGDTGRHHAWDVGVAAGNLFEGAWWQADLAVARLAPAERSTRRPNSQVFMTGGWRRRQRVFRSAAAVMSDNAQAF